MMGQCEAHRNLQGKAARGSGRLWRHLRERKEGLRDGVLCFLRTLAFSKACLFFSTPRPFQASPWKSLMVGEWPVVVGQPLRQLRFPRLCQLLLWFPLE